MSRGVLAVRRGRAPNCSATGAVVGGALLTLLATSVVVNTFADRFAAWLGRAPEDPEKGGPNSPTVPPAKLRRERFGALFALPGPTAAILFLDPTAAQAALDAGAASCGDEIAVDGALSAPIEVHLAVTGRCPVACDGCYLDAGPDVTGPDPDLEAELDRLSALGVFEIALGGGEAVLRDDLLTLARGIRARGMVPNLTTSGFGITDAMAARMAEVFGQVNVSLDGLGEDYRAVRGWDGARVGLAAIDKLVAAGLRVGVNTVLAAPNVGSLESMARALAARGVSEWQWLRFKPAGRGVDSYARLALSPAETTRLWPRALAIEAETGLVLRWDCAMVPFLAEHQVPIEHLERLGVTGCPGGHSLLTRGVDGRWSPCSFAHDDAADGAPEEVWRHGDAIQRWRDRAETPPEPCGSCDYRAVCRGGCRVVARALTGDAMAPDPECARVRSCA